jgi:hypothetical protein
MIATLLFDAERLAERALVVAREAARRAAGGEASPDQSDSPAAAALDAQRLAERALAMIAEATRRETRGAAGDAGGPLILEGPAGPPGPQGPPGPGGEGLRFVGAWDNQHDYAKGDVVVWRDNAWICTRAGQGGEPGGEEPVMGSTWTVLVARGEKGPPGRAGRGVPRGGTAGQVLAKKTDLSFDTEWVTGGGGGGVASFEGRIGAVASAAGDYTAAEIANVPAGTVAATTVQAAIDELDQEKAPNAHGHVAADIADFAEAAQDAVGNALTDTATIQFTYDDPTGDMSAVAVTQMSLAADASGLKLAATPRHPAPRATTAPTAPAPRASMRCPPAVRETPSASTARRRRTRISTTRRRRRRRTPSTSSGRRTPARRTTSAPTCPTRRR